MIFDENIAKKITLKSKYVNSLYPQYFQPEILPYKNKKWFPKYCEWKNPYNEEEEERNEWVNELKKELPENFEELRQIGENPSYICKLIREDNVKDFIYKNNYPIKSEIKPSIYETNSFLLQPKMIYLDYEVYLNFNVTLINYALFFGSIQTFNYLKINGAELNSESWLYSIHGQNAELIHKLERRQH